MKINELMENTDITSLKRGKWFYDVNNDVFIFVGSNISTTDTHSWKVYSNPEMFGLTKEEVQKIKEKYIQGEQKFDYIPEMVFAAMKNGFVRITDVLNRNGSRTIEGVSEKHVRKAIKRMQEEGVHLYEITVAIRNGDNLEDGIVKHLSDDMIDDFVKGGLNRVNHQMNLSPNIVEALNKESRKKINGIIENSMLVEWLSNTFDKSQKHNINDMVTVWFTDKWNMM